MKDQHDNVTDDMFDDLVSIPVKLNSDEIFDLMLISSDMVMRCPQLRFGQAFCNAYQQEYCTNGESLTYPELYYLTDKSKFLYLVKVFLEDDY